MPDWSNLVCLKAYRFARDSLRTAALIDVAVENRTRDIHTGGGVLHHHCVAFIQFASTHLQLQLNVLLPTSRRTASYISGFGKVSILIGAELSNNTRNKRELHSLKFPQALGSVYPGQFSSEQRIGDCEGQAPKLSTG